MHAYTQVRKYATCQAVLYVATQRDCTLCHKTLHGSSMLSDSADQCNHWECDIEIQLFNSNDGTGIWHGILPGLQDPEFSLSGDRLEGESATRGNFVQQALSETDSLHQVSSIGCSIVRQKRPLAASSGHASYGSPWR